MAFLVFSATATRAGVISADFFGLSLGFLSILDFLFALPVVLKDTQHGSVRNVLRNDHVIFRLDCDPVRVVFSDLPCRAHIDFALGHPKLRCPSLNPVWTGLGRGQNVSLLPLVVRKKPIDVL